MVSILHSSTLSGRRYLNELMAPSIKVRSISLDQNRRTTVWYSKQFLKLSNGSQFYFQNETQMSPMYIVQCTLNRVHCTVYTVYVDSNSYHSYSYS